MKLTTLNGNRISPIGAGTWQIGDQKNKESEEIFAIKQGIHRGLNLIDTAEMYGNGASEILVGKATEDEPRESLFLVSKVLPENANTEAIKRSLDKSLKNLKTDFLDLYLLHWKSSYPLQETVEAFERAKKEGKIRNWGVSNFDVSDLKKLEKVSGGENCVANQIKYNLIDRGAEFDLLPYMEQSQMNLMAYSPIYKGRFRAFTNEQETVLENFALRHNARITQIMLAWVIRHKDVVAIPKASSEKHMIDNIESNKINLSESDLKEINRVFPPPISKTSLALW